MKKTINTGLFASLFLTQAAFAAPIDATSAIRSNLGTQEAITATTSCDVDNMGGEGGGNLAVVNMVPCLINRQAGIHGATTGVTKSMAFDGNSFKARIVIEDAGVTIDGVSYDYEAKIWTCEGTCSAAADFYPAIWMAFSANGNKTTNKGVVVNNFGASDGSFVGSAFIKWDSGTGSAKRVIESVQGECRSDSSFDSRFMDYERTVTSGGLTKLSTITGNATVANNYASIVLDSNSNVGYAADDINQTSTASFTRTAGTVVLNDASTASDYNYAVGGTYTGTFLGLPTFNGASYAGVVCTGSAVTGGATNGSIDGIGKGVGVLSTPMTNVMNGMTLHPTSI